jgi:hypothetical protein
MVVALFIIGGALAGAGSALLFAAWLMGREWYR